MIGRADLLNIMFIEHCIEHCKGVCGRLGDFVEQQWREVVGHCDLPSLYVR